MNDVGAMEDDYNNILSEEINMDLDIGVGVSFIEDPIMDIVENEVDCSDAFKTTEVVILFIWILWNMWIIFLIWLKFMFYL